MLITTHSRFANINHVNPSGASEFIHNFSGVRVTRSIVSCVVFNRSLFICLFCLLAIVVCSSSIYGF